MCGLIAKTRFEEQRKESIEGRKSDDFVHPGTDLMNCNEGETPQEKILSAFLRWRKCFYELITQFHMDRNKTSPTFYSRVFFHSAQLIDEK